MNKTIFLQSNRFPFESEGKSMIPILKEKDLIYFKNISFSKIKENNIIGFYKNKKIITHRVIYKNKNYLITKGDNNFYNDGKIYPRQIIGIVDKIRRNNKILRINDIYFIQSSIYLIEIIKLKKQLDKEKINYLFLKGLPLYLYFDKTYPKKIYSDCDILIEEKDFNKAVNILINLGYIKSKDNFFKNKKNKPEESYYKIINNFFVVFDFHKKAFFPLKQIENKNFLYENKLLNKLNNCFLKNKQKVKINNEYFYILKNEFLVLYLALHIFHHNFKGYQQYLLLNKIIKKLTKNNKNLFILIKKYILEYKLSNFLYPVFYLLKKYYKTPINNSFLIKININKINVKKLNIDIFNQENRINSGIKRFINLFILSPNPLYKKILIFLNKDIFFIIIFVIRKKLFNSIFQLFHSKVNR